MQMEGLQLEAEGYVLMLQGGKRLCAIRVRTPGPGRGENRFAGRRECSPHARPASPLSSGRAGACEYSSVDSGVRLGPQNW